MNYFYVILKARNILKITFSLLLLSACHGISFVPKAEMVGETSSRIESSRSLNTLSSISRTASRDSGPSLSELKDNKRTIGGIRIKNDTPDESDDAVFRFKRYRSQYVAETTLMDKSRQKAYFSVGGVDAGNHTVGFQFRLEF